MCEEKIEKLGSFENHPCRMHLIIFERPNIFHSAATAAAPEQAIAMLSSLLFMEML